MKRLLIIIISLLVAIPLAIGVMAGMAYYTTSEDSVPTPTLTVMDTQLPRAGYSWREPVFGGMIHRDFESPALDSQRLGTLTDPQLLLEPPEGGYKTTIQVLYKNEEVWSGSAAELTNYRFMTNGQYKLLIDCEKPEEQKRGYGHISYICDFTVAVEPQLEVSGEWVKQGDIAAIQLYNLPEGVIPTAESELGEVHFLTTGENTVTAFLPIGHARDPDYDYVVYVKAGSHEWEQHIRVIEENWKMENIVVEREEGEVVDPEAPPVRIQDVAKASPADYGEYAELIRPLFEVYDEEAQWDGLFTMPVKGNITVDYGQYTYANTTTSSLRQSGIGIAAAEGLPVLAPNNGRVLFAGATEDMGNVVVIEHGGGLKSLLFFLGELEVKRGDTVEKDQRIAVTPEKGFSDTATVYFETRLGYETLSPMSLVDGSSKLYYFSSPYGDD